MNKTKFEKQKKWHNFALFNFLAQDAENATEVMDAADGYAVPGIVASDFDTPEEAVARLNELKKASDIVSVGLGGGGAFENFRSVLRIAELDQDCHINQPLETAAFAQLVDGIYANALVRPSGKVGIVNLATGGSIEVERLVDYCLEHQIPSIKLMSIRGTEHLDELVYLAKVAGERGIYGIEPAGGIAWDNIVPIISEVAETGIPFFMPHIFGATIDQATGRTKKNEIERIFEQLGGIS
ncbi:KDGP aldolase [Listeria kieliensis]|uniref:Imidazolonepropionase n=1 Tax=Listeria kieliensis TaxID=1621700 RepID=A0A3D8TUN4_9LIST|nr:KDGP aldolase [Listeria kieliensis]RDX02585.1 imidazolonepropionase [Listeria kieliensis]